ncbi:MAG: heavy metal translocating P-type ATPase [Eubacteriales bacterium]|nr:heavy metal translocating P-type ATPase [Eubacteriales bacterium]
MNKKQKKMLKRIIAAAAMMILLEFIPSQGILRFILYMIPYLIIGYDILRKAVKGILNKQVFDENFLMAIATVGAIVLAVSGNGDYTEAVAVMLFYQIGELFQSYAIGKSRKNISELMDIRPDYANLEINGQVEETDPDEVPTGSIIVVNPGEKVPIDGIIINGNSSINTLALTGESIPRDVSEGMEIISGCINLSSPLRIQTTKEFGESTVSKILELVENASSRKSKSENFISKFARIYTPVVVYSALALALIPPIVSLMLSMPAMWSVWLYRALTFLVISCPCALVISIPLSFFAAIGGAGKEGILIKGSNFMEKLAKTDCVVFDKTGTLTKGVFEVSGIYNNTIEEHELLRYAAHAESASSHPISRSLIKAYGNEIDRSIIGRIEEISGKGINAEIDGHNIKIGNARLMADAGINYVSSSNLGTLIYVALDNEFAGEIVISDIVKPQSAESINKLHNIGVKKTIMLTGDSEAVAAETAQKLGLNGWYSELLPGDRVSKLEDLLRQQSDKSSLAFVGDGINDAPVLSRADIGIAMGALGSDAAIEAADIVLMDDDPMKVAKAIRISRHCIKIVYENIYFAIGIKLLVLVLGAFGLANMWAAIFADVGVMVLAVLNAIRTLNVKKL